MDHGAVRGPKYIRDVRLPTADEVEKHMMTHLPYRNWCEYCVKGRGREAAHSRSTGEASDLPEVSLDCCFPTKEDGTGGLTILVARERHTRMTLATVVPSKSTGTFAAKRVVEFLKEIGCRTGDLLLKTDQEPAIRALVAEICKVRAAEGSTGRVIEEMSPKGSSGSNGVVERAVQSVEQQIRTMACALQDRWKAELPSKHPIWTWITEYSAYLLNRCEVSTDGRTAYERSKGKSAHFCDHEFGEVVLWKKQSTRGPLGKLSTTWSKGIFLGVRGLTGELRVGTTEGVFRSRTVQRVPQEERWTPEAADLVGGVPWLLSGQDEEADGEALKQETLRPLSEELLEETRVREPVPRSFNITPQDLHDHGYTAKCPGCVAVLRGTARQGHNDECRARLEEAMKDMPRLGRLERGWTSILQRDCAKKMRKGEVLRREQKRGSDLVLLRGGRRKHPPVQIQRRHPGKENVMKKRYLMLIEGTLVLKMRRRKKKT